MLQAWIYMSRRCVNAFIHDLHVHFFSCPIGLVNCFLPCSQNMQICRYINQTSFSLQSGLGTEPLQAASDTRPLGTHGLDRVFL